MYPLLAFLFPFLESFLFYCLLLTAFKNTIILNGHQKRNSNHFLMFYFTKHKIITHYLSLYFFLLYIYYLCLKRRKSPYDGWSQVMTNIILFFIIHLKIIMLWYYTRLWYIVSVICFSVLFLLIFLSRNNLLRDTEKKLKKYRFLGSYLLRHENLEKMSNN